MSIEPVHLTQVWMLSGASFRKLIAMKYALNMPQ